MVFLAERQDEDLIGMVVDAGAIGCFVEPIDLKVLGPSVHAWLARSAAARRQRDDRGALLRAMGDSRSIGMAVGILSERHRLPPEQAFDALRRQARRERHGIAMLAAAVVGGTEDLVRDR